MQQAWAIRESYNTSKRDADSLNFGDSPLRPSALCNLRIEQKTTLQKILTAVSQD